MIEQTDAVRRFNRFYTRQIGALDEGLLRSSLTLPEGRLVYELAQRGETSAAELANELRLDSGYLSRLLRGLEQRDLLSRRPSENDGRQNVISLTDKGRAEYDIINTRSGEEIAALLNTLPRDSRVRLVRAMETIERLLGGRADDRVPFIIRTHRPGDIGWITHRHGILYADEYGWDETFEALVAEIVAKFIQNFQPKRERCWVAERDGEIVGSIFLVEDTASVSKLRLLYVEPSARGLGIGGRLVEECLRFARQAGYSKVSLWTNDVLVSARRIYEAAGFQLVEEERHQSFGHDLVGQNWELDLSKSSVQVGSQSPAAHS